MKILIDINHPAQVHFFRNAITELQQRGHKVAVTAREKDVTTELLKNFGIPFTMLSRKGANKFALVAETIVRYVRLWNFCRKFKPDILTGAGSIFAAVVGWLRGKPVVTWERTEIAGLVHRLTCPFATAIYSPDCFTKFFGKKHHFYHGYHALAYLHPNRFTADAQIVKSLGINPDEKYCIIRFVSWQAYHDLGQHGFADEQKLDFVKQIAEYARPYICSETALPKELEPYRLDIPPHQIHHVMAFASLCVGEGASTASESAILGVPTVYINTLKLGFINVLEEYGLLKQTTDTNQALKLCLHWLTDPETKQKCRAAHKKLLADSLDVTSYIVDVIETTPQ